MVSVVHEIVVIIDLKVRKKRKRKKKEKEKKRKKRKKVGISPFDAKKIFGLVGFRDHSHNFPGSRPHLLETTYNSSKSGGKGVEDPLKRESGGGGPRGISKERLTRHQHVEPRVYTDLYSGTTSWDNRTQGVTMGYLVTTTPREEKKKISSSTSHLFTLRIPIIQATHDQKGERKMKERRKRGERIEREEEKEKEKEGVLKRKRKKKKKKKNGKSFRFLEMKSVV